jgi:hypothetical protein
MLGQKAHQKVEQYQQPKTATSRGPTPRQLNQKVERYQQLKTEQPEAYAAKLNAAVSRKKKKKKQETACCPRSAHGRCFAARARRQCKSIWCYSK